MALYRIDEADGSLSPIPETSLSGEGMSERDDLQRWLRDHPDALGDGLFVLAEEYGEWAGSSRRIDLLALDQDGRLVVIELKRDEGAFMDLQAIRYAAMVAHMTLDRAVAAHERHLQARGIEGDARERILGHLGAGEGKEPEIESAKPQIVLAARDFSQELTTSVLWLNDAGLDISCVRLLPYRVGDDLVLDVTQVIPLPEAKDYVVRVRDKAIEAEPHKYPDVPWTDEDIELLAGMVENPAILTAIDLCAADPGQWTPLTTIIEQSGQTQAQVQGSLARLTAIVRGDFGRNNWPLVVEGRPSDADGSQRAHYLMTAQVAEWWKAARSTASDS
ncbi:MAG: DUF91 domain-containing protein [Chloroflexi bacterium]|nr:DUF91 domain-containing protein [Chloroflexota bacterium]